jgi:hypothetical protein
VQDKFDVVSPLWFACSINFLIDILTSAKYVYAHIAGVCIFFNPARRKALFRLLLSHSHARSMPRAPMQFMNITIK